MKKKELVLVECPECKGLGDVPFYTWEGDKDWDVCHVCKGEKKILTKKVKTS
jgi:DnaJ-class molecular chaperone